MGENKLMSELKDLVVLVTGASRGTGKAIARKFLEEGATVVATDLNAPDWNFEKAPGKLIAKAMNVTDAATVEKVVEEINSKTTGINVLVNNAGITVESPIVDSTDKMFDSIMNVNLRGPFNTMRAVSKNLIAKKQPGAIVNIASIAGKNGFQNCSIYGGSKAGVIGFTRSLAPELGPYDITVNAVCPGSVDTVMLNSVMENISKNANMNMKEVREMMASGIPMRRLQQPEDIAAICLFLASNGARNISGESLNIDGGVVRD
jgi:NAD(P)-dependent dehydrogenase (short-subunit alcohol dehydrogenase family)